MTHWTVDAPTTLEFDDVMALHVRLIGTVAVLASDDKRSSPGGTLRFSGGTPDPWPAPPGPCPVKRRVYRAGRRSR